MGNAGDASSSETLEELVEQTRGPRAAIVNGLRFYGGEAHAQQLRQYEGIPSKNYHFNKLKDQGVIEETGDEYVGQGGTAKTYGLTNLGREVADALAESAGVTAAITGFEERIDQQSEAIEEAQKEIEILQQRYNAIADFVEDQDDEIDSLKQSHNRIADFVETLDERMRDADL